MKQLPAFMALICLALSGCVNGPQMTPETGASIVRLTVGTGATLALNKNPKYIPVAGALAAGIDAAIAGTTTLTLAGIDAYVKQVCAKNNVPDVDVALFINLANTIYTAYVAHYKPTVISSTDPNVILYVNAFKEGLNDAVMATSSATLK